MNQELDLTNLRKIAEQATPGPWEAKPYLYGVDDDGRIRVTSPSDGGSYNLAESVLPNEAKHIATFDPPTVLALITRLEQAEAAVARVRVVAHDIRENPDKYNPNEFSHPETTYMNWGFRGGASAILRALDGEQG